MGYPCGLPNETFSFHAHGSNPYWRNVMLRYELIKLAIFGVQENDDEEKSETQKKIEALDQRIKDLILVEKIRKKEKLIEQLEKKLAK